MANAFTMGQGGGSKIADMLFADADDISTYTKSGIYLEIRNVPKYTIGTGGYILINAATPNGYNFIAAHRYNSSGTSYTRILNENFNIIKHNRTDWMLSIRAATEELRGDISDGNGGYMLRYAMYGDYPDTTINWVKSISMEALTEKFRSLFPLLA